MNVRNTILLLTLGFFLVSCDEIKSRLNQDDSPVVSGEDTISDVEDETIVESDNPRTKNFYTSLLESFCNKYFDEHFSGDIYEKGSLVVVKIKPLEGKTVQVSGTHSYKVEMGSKVSGQMFKATISEKGDNLYDIKFEKGSSKVFSDNSYWDSIEMEYHYE
ncbi:MAG: hypothetical protein IKH88_00590 [Prevotella sp.]|nr:hypothetical protein [Prevotella sp.]